MKKLAVLLSAFVLALGLNTASATEWKVDASHSSVEFAVSHMVISETTGEFKKFDIGATTDGDDWATAKINVTIQVNSVDTDDEKRDGHLASPDFFDAEKYPTITFVSKSMKKAGDKKYKLTGDLTIRGKTKTVTLDVKLGGVVKDPWGNTRAGFKLTGEVNRMDFGVSWNKALDAGGLVVGETVEITANVELIKQG